MTFVETRISLEREALAERRSARLRLKATPTVWYFERSGGNNSVVECDLAKVEVAGSNPVSRSNFSRGALAPFHTLRSVGPNAHSAARAVANDLREPRLASRRSIGSRELGWKLPRMMWGAPFGPAVLLFRGAVAKR